MPAEQVFSAAGLLTTKLRSRLSPQHVDASIFLCQNTFLPSSRIFGTAMKEQEASAAVTVVLTSEDLEEFEEVEVLGYEPPLPESDSDDDMNY